MRTFHYIHSIECQHRKRIFGESSQSSALFPSLRPGKAMAKIQQPLPARMPRSASGSRIGPAVAEAHKVFNLGKCFIALEELLSYAPDDSSNVYPITVFAAPSDEAFVVDPIVDRPIGHPVARFLRQEMDDVVLDQGEAHVDVFPISSPDVR